MRAKTFDAKFERGDDLTKDLNLSQALGRHASVHYQSMDCGSIGEGFDIKM